ncbi:leucine-rich repeats and immunoglobulin-like domains protein 1 isoform X2 [Sitophilus oryzae]|uniref:Leucine-rich repeats and immunoglobulin-like domains protein 1 isoform X2 n=1 Tax=Sitophilus oryzae TaxID=7048 RepID=A0A6J2XWW7_SITOR|nr:leucine-rich repeats and immunoglobulin-like domains protein 1 isoform X2 [Sitophilus oryzae]
MSPKKPVENLSKLCAEIVILELQNIIKRNGEDSLTFLEQYIENIPQKLADDLLQSVLDISNLTSPSKWIIFNAFQHFCTRFDSRNVSPKYHERFVENLKHVYHLNLTGARVSSVCIKNLIKRCQNLRSLVIPGHANNDILELIGGLPKLEFLDISNGSFTLEGLKFIKNHSIQVLSIGVVLTRSLASSDQGYDILVNLIEQLPNLTEIRTYGYTGGALLYFKKPYVSKLRVLSDCFTNTESMKAIIGVCPDLQELTLDDPEVEVYDLLEELKHLKKLVLRRFCAKPSEICLKTLTLETLQAQNVCLDLKDMCITLETLRLTHCVILDSSKRPRLFKNLRVIELIDCDVDKEIIMTCLRTCDQLQRLAASKELNLTDEDIKKLCERRCLVNLEELWLSIARNLTSESVITLMNHCDKLRLIGTLNGWRMEKVEVNYLKVDWMIPNKPNATISIGNITITAGREAIFSCIVNITGRYKVAWVRAEDQTILSIGTKVVTHNSRISVTHDNLHTWQIRIKQVKETDKGCYLCQVNTNTVKTQEGCLDVNVPPDILNEDTSGDFSVSEGENATLWCKASGHPPPRVLWKKENGEPIFIRRSFRNFSKVDTFNGTSLNFWKVDRTQMGTYLCIASNDVPPAVSKRMSMYVNFSPTIKVPNQLLGAPINTDVQLECYVEAFPNTINYWVKNRSEMLLNGTKYVVREERIGYTVFMWLVIKSFSNKDVGTYNCVSTNSLGKAEGTLRLYEIKLNPVSTYDSHSEVMGGVAEPARGTRSKEVTISSNSSCISPQHFVYLLLAHILTLS